jgi:hypothetical protein
MIFKHYVQDTHALGKKAHVWTDAVQHDKSAVDDLEPCSTQQAEHQHYFLPLLQSFILSSSGSVHVNAISCC